MVKIIQGIYGYRNADGVIQEKKEDSEPFELTKDQEERLVKRGVAVYVNTEVAPAQPQSREEELQEMSYEGIKKLAKEHGIKQGKKEEMIAEIMEAEEEDGEEGPDLSAELPS